ncbi:MAG: Hsp70 family protein [Alphaproteobacteria bacterium]|nr:Hsp70 family protein [Alphaproteobacteria bacterium]
MYIGIDLGTTNSVIAGVQEGQAQIFRPADGGETLPSVIYIDKRGHRLFGRRAYDQALIAPDHAAMGFKRLMGTATPLIVGDDNLTAESCSAEILRQLLGQVVTESGIDSFDGACIAVPAAFNQMQAEATLRAAKMAGLEQVDLVQEPVAAAMAAMKDAKRSGKFLIYDLGGGTFDVALVQSNAGAVRILAQAGVNMLGGRDFDRMIVSEIVRPWLLANFDLPENFLRLPAYHRLAVIARLAAERAKIDLTTLEEAAVFASDDEVRLTDESETEIFLDVPITRGQFESLIVRSVEQTIELIRALLQEHQVDPSEVDRIVYIGGSSRIPLVRRMMTESLGIAPDLNVDPMTAVAEGAAYYCESRTWQEAEDKDIDEVSSAPKDLAGHMEMPHVPGLSFDYEARSADDKAQVVVKAPREDGSRQIRLMTEGWDSGMLALSDGLNLSVPLPVVGENVFDVQLMDKEGKQLEDLPAQLSITRLVARAVGVPASHSIAVKARPSLESEENVFVYLVNKGEDLPAKGILQLRSGTNLRSGTAAMIGFEVFQVEYPERVELNLCVGLLRIEGSDLPKGQAIKAGDAIDFHWSIKESGELRVSVSLPESNLQLPAQRFYAPSAAEFSFSGENGQALVRSILSVAQEAWGEVAAAVGPQAGPEVEFLHARLDEQQEILAESLDDPETMRRVSEEARFIAQDVAKLSAKYKAPLLQRRLGRMTALFNRAARRQAAVKESQHFDDLAGKVQKIIDSQHEMAYPAAQLCLSDMQRLFFTVAWRNPSYVKAWFAQLSQDRARFADQKEHEALVQQGQQALESGDEEALRGLVKQLFDLRMSFGTGDGMQDLANVVKG